MYGLAMTDAAGVGALVGVVRDREQQAEVGERREDDGRAVQHRPPSRASSPRFGDQRHQRDEHRPGDEDVRVEHRHAENVAGTLNSARIG